MEYAAQEATQRAGDSFSYFRNGAVNQGSEQKACPGPVLVHKPRRLGQVARSRHDFQSSGGVRVVGARYNRDRHDCRRHLNPARRGLS